jgi:hypothetical protein
MVRDIYKGEQTQSVGEEVIPVQFAISANSNQGRSMRRLSLRTGGSPVTNQTNSASIRARSFVK